MVKCWVNRDDVDFGNAEDLTGSMTLDLVDPDEVRERRGMGAKHEDGLVKVVGRRRWL